MPGFAAEPVNDLADPVGRARQAMLSTVRDVADFPSPGIGFKDITPTLADPDAFAAVIAGLTALVPEPVDLVAGVESRGFLLAAPMALRLGSGVLVVRKAGKLPGPTRAITYDLEYGSATLEIQDTAVSAPSRVAPGSRPRVVVVDDVLATGGTVEATIQLLRGAGADIVCVVVALELSAVRAAAGQLISSEVRSLAAV